MWVGRTAFRRGEKVGVSERVVCGVGQVFGSWVLGLEYRGTGNGRTRGVRGIR